MYASLIGPVRWYQGRGHELLPMTEVMVADNPDRTVMRAGLARMYADAGRDDDARQLLTAENATGFDHPNEMLNLIVLTFWAEAAGRIGDPTAAETLYQQLAPRADVVATNVLAVYGSIAHYLGHLATVLGRYDTAEGHFTHALAMHEALQAPFFMARTHLEWGRMLMARGQPDDAQAAGMHLESALDLAQRYGCALVEQRAAELLEQL